jgi:hypothetical protein
MGACGGSGEDADLCLCSQVRCERRETWPHEFRHVRGVWLCHLLLACQAFGSSPPPPFGSLLTLPLDKVTPPCQDYWVKTSKLLWVTPPNHS